MSEGKTHHWIVDGIRMEGNVDENGAIVVSSPDCREVLTQADTVEDAQRQSRDVLQLVVDWYKDEGRELPAAYKPETA